MSGLVRPVLRLSVWLYLLAALSISAPLLAAPAEGGEQTMAEQLQQVLKTSFWSVLVFVAVLFILWKKLFPVIIEGLDRRAAMIQDSLDAAKKAKEEAEAMMARHEASLEKARAESRAIIEEAKEDALKVKNGIVADAQKEALEIQTRTRRELELAKQATVDDLYRQASQLTFDLASKVIAKSLDPKDHQQLIDSCIDEYRTKV